MTGLPTCARRHDRHDLLLLGLLGGSTLCMEKILGRRALARVRVGRLGLRGLIAREWDCEVYCLFHVLRAIYCARVGE